MNPSEKGALSIQSVQKPWGSARLNQGDHSLRKLPYPGLFTKVVEEREPSPVYGLVARKLTKGDKAPVSDCATQKISFETPTPLALEAAFDGGRLTSDGSVRVSV